ncbi:putative sodium/metabolite cotransporter BASS5 [Cardamine amara subsp. amara]|uniref:Sodium/metabolite cotransporter BASS5 n=1 Tax=Cardamine amara subsp. amara TaxID=228776 RepID=A0ABD1B5K8_CARAN
MGVISPVETLFLKSQHCLLKPRDYSYPVGFHNTRRVSNFPRNSLSVSSLGSCSVDFPLRSNPILQNGRLSYPWRRNRQTRYSETLLYPPSFTWFKPRYFVPGLGFMMFAVGINSNQRDFLEALKRPDAIFAGYIGQYLIKPILGYIFGVIFVSLFHLPTPIGAGIMLVSCVSGAQLSNYTTFLTDPSLAPLSIVMTSISSATAILVTPMLSLLLIGKKLPVDVIGMISSILQVVVTPIAAGLLLNRLLPRLSNAIKPFLPALTVIDMACCIGAPLALNIDSILSPFGAIILLLVVTFHLLAFIAGYYFTGFFFSKAPDAKALQRTLSYETRMQSSLLALALATKFFQDPLVGVPPAISTVVMSLMGCSLVTIWKNKKE